MTHDAKALKSALEQRKIELQRLINQMKNDRLHQSTVFKNLEQELSGINRQLLDQEHFKRKSPASR